MSVSQEGLTYGQSVRKVSDMSKVWIVKSGNWYLHSAGWFKPQRYAHRFKTRREAESAVEDVKSTGFDARIVRLVPKTDDWVVRFIDDENHYVLNPMVYADGEPDCFVTSDLREATRFEPTAALMFAAAYNRVSRRDGIAGCDIEAVPCSTL